MRDMALLPFCLVAARKVLLHIHAGGIAEALPRLPRPLARFAPRVYRKCAAAIVLTEFSRRDADSLGIQHIHVVSNSLPDSFDAALLERSHVLPIRLLSVGHLGPPKGTPTLLRAVAALREAGKDVHLTVIGEPLPPYSERALEELLGALDLGDAVDVAGIVVGDAKWEVFARSDIFVFPSTAPESQPVVLIEAMMWGLPIVASDWRAHAEILGDPPGGLCYELGDDSAESLSRALERALNSDRQLEDWGRHNRQRYLDRFDAVSSPLLSFIRDTCSPV
jgi:glycosyltransferase involved in cell wall biosynthesis